MYLSSGAGSIPGACTLLKYSPVLPTEAWPWRLGSSPHVQLAAPDSDAVVEHRAEAQPTLQRFPCRTPGIVEDMPLEWGWGKDF